MALIVITIKDNDNGSCDVFMQDHPKVEEDQKDFSPAQHLAATALNAIHNELKDIKPIDMSQAKGKDIVLPFARKPTLVLPGADGNP